MRQSLKIALSLLAALLLFAGFAVLAFSGLFNVLQANFFLPRIESVYKTDLDSVASVIEKFHAANLEAYARVAQRDFVAASLNVRLDDATLKGWKDTLAQLQVFGVRLIGTETKRILYSSLPEDVKGQAPGGVSFKNYNEDGRDIPVERLLLKPEKTSRVLIRGAQFVYCVPVTSAAAGGVNERATLAFYVDVKLLLSQITISAVFPVDQVSLVADQGILINWPPVSEDVSNALLAIWARNAGSSSFVASLPLASKDGATANYRIFSRRLAGIDEPEVASTLVPAARFEMSDLMKGLLLATFFFTVFLLIFLLLNLRSDPLEVLRQRVKRFQIQLITELVESPGGADWGKWRREMEARKDEITWQIQRGIGRVSPRKKPVIDEYMDKSWAEIIDLISRRVETPPVPAVAAMDLSRLESLIQTALQNAKFVLPAPRQVSHAPDVEEISASEIFEEPQEGAKVSEGAARTATSPQPVEVLTADSESEAEELEEIEPVEEAKTLEKAEAIEELEAVEEAEEIEEAESIDTQRIVEGAPVIDRQTAPGFVQSEIVEEAEAVEDVEPSEELEEAESVEEIRPLEEAVELPEAEAFAEAEPAGEPEYLVESEFIEEAELIGENQPGKATEVETLEVESLVSEEVLSAEDAGEEARAFSGSSEQGPQQAFAGKPAEAASRAGVRRARHQGEVRGRGLLRTAISDFIEIRIPRGDAGKTVAKAEAASRGPEHDAAAEQLEELVPLHEIQPLPPLPVEEGLETLPPADEGHGGGGAAEEAALRMRSDDYRRSMPEGGVEPEELAELEFSTRGMNVALPEEQTDFEELEPVEEEPEERAAASHGAPSEADRAAELDSLVKSGSVKAWTIDDLNRLVEEGKSAIVMENGIFRIKEEVYTAGEREAGKDAGSTLRELAQEVVRHAEKEAVERSASPEAALSEEPVAGGIGDLLRDEDNLDLSKVISGEKEPAPEESLTVDGEKANPLRLKRNGLDYDEFLSSYPRSFTHTIQMKSLVEVSRRVSAVSAALFLKKAVGFVPDLTVGLSDNTVSTCVFELGEPFSAAFLKERKAVAIDKNPAEIRFLNTRIDADDLRFMKRILFIPAVFRSQDAFLFLSFSGETDISMNVMLSKLVIS